MYHLSPAKVWKHGRICITVNIKNNKEAIKHKLISLLKFDI
jgi:hypothetical protein